jgi:hypothetical protein
MLASTAVREIISRRYFCKPFGAPFYADKPSSSMETISPVSYQPFSGGTITPDFQLSYSRALCFYLLRKSLLPSSIPGTSSSFTSIPGKTLRLYRVYNTYAYLRKLPETFQSPRNRHYPHPEIIEKLFYRVFFQFSAPTTAILIE